MKNFILSVDLEIVALEAMAAAVVDEDAIDGFPDM
jgi:hypothetical protein